MIMILKVISLYYQLKDFNPPFFSDCLFSIHFCHMFSCYLVMFGSWGVISEDPGYWSFSKKGGDEQIMWGARAAPGGEWLVIGSMVKKSL